MALKGEVFICLENKFAIVTGAGKVIAELVDVEAATLTYGKLDILVNNAGIMDGMGPVGEITDEKWDPYFQ